MAAPEPMLSAHAWAYLKFVGETVYGTQFRSAVQTAVRFQHNLEDFLTNKDVAAAWNACIRKVPEPIPTSPKLSDNNDNNSVCLDILHQAASELSQPMLLAGETQPTALAAADAAVRLVSDHCAFIESDQSLTSLVSAFKSCKEDCPADDSSISMLVIVYDVKVS